MAALKSPDALVRYWAAVAALTAKTLPDLKPLLTDKEIVVRLAAAEAILQRGDNAGARAVVEAGLQAKLPEARLFAINVAARLPGELPPAWRPILQRLDDVKSRNGPEDYVIRAAMDLMEAKP